MVRWHYFERGTRYYRVTLQQDLFGAWVLKREWGSIPKHSLRSLVMIADSYDQAAQLLEAAKAKRLKRKYVEREHL